MRLYYLKIFFKKNSPNSFNMNLVFPFMATMLCSVIVLLTYSAMNTLEREIINEITAVNGHSRIYLESNKDFNNKYEKISKFLQEHQKGSSLSIEGIGYLMYDKNNHMPIKVIGLSALDQIRNKLNIDLTTLNSLEGKILISQESYNFLNIVDSINQEISLYYAMDPSSLKKSIELEVVEERFKGSNINAIENMSENYVFIDYTQAKDLFKYTPSYISTNEVLDEEELDFINNNIAKIEYREWTDIYPVFFDAVKVERFLYTSFGFVLVLIASFNLYGLINLIIYRKKNQLATLLYQGMAPVEIKSIFVSNILIIGVLASSLGILTSFLLVNTNIISKFIPMLKNIEISIFIIPFSFIFNLICLYIFTRISIKNNIKNIEVLKHNVVEG